MWILEALIERKNSDEIVIETEYESITYAQLYRYSATMAYFINKMVNENNIGIYVENNVDYIICYFSALFAGKCVVPIKMDLILSNVEKVLKKAEVRWIISDKLVQIENINVIAPVRNENGPFFEIDRCISDNIMLMETTGTTNMRDRKLVRISEENLKFVTESYVNTLNLSAIKNIKFWILAPLQSSFGNYVFLSCISTGAVIYMRDNFLPWEFRNIILNEKITHIECISSLLFSLLKICKETEWGSLMYLGFGGEATGQDEILMLLERFRNVQISQGYGLTEASPLISIFPPRISVDEPQVFRKKALSVGKILQGIDVLVEDDGNNGIGEILVSGPNITKGYYKERCEEIFKSGYLKTGDIGYVDEDGYLYIIGRKKNIVIIEGKNVQLEEVEHIIRLFPKVKETRVYVMKDVFLGEQLCAEILPLEEFTKKDLKKFLLKKIEYYKIPSKITIINEIERIGGKIRRK